MPEERPTYDTIQGPQYASGVFLVSGSGVAGLTNVEIDLNTTEPFEIAAADPDNHIGLYGLVLSFTDATTITFTGTDLSFSLDLPAAGVLDLSRGTPYAKTALNEPLMVAISDAVEVKGFVSIGNIGG